MSGRAGLVLCPEARIYDHGPGHPLRPQRVLLTWDLIRHLGLLDRPTVQTLACRIASDEEIGLVHTAEFIGDHFMRALEEHGEVPEIVKRALSRPTLQDLFLELLASANVSLEDLFLGPG
ncbi:MAG TPA: hypothetical protein VNA32_03990, partial [Actinomycetota bacterium]|nr:hypothetical protein [Actinomycetota bacterium]